MENEVIALLVLWLIEAREMSHEYDLPLVKDTLN